MSVQADRAYRADRAYKADRLYAVCALTAWYAHASCISLVSFEDSAITFCATSGGICS